MPNPRGKPAVLGSCLISALKASICRCTHPTHCLCQGLVTLSVNHAPVEDPGYHAALLVVELQRDSLQDRKSHDCLLEGRAPAFSAKSSPCPCPRGAACCSSSWHKHRYPLMRFSVGPQAGCSTLFPRPRSPETFCFPPGQAVGTAQTAPPPLGASRLGAPASSHHGLLCDLLKLDEANLAHLAGTAMGGAACSR